MEKKYYYKSIIRKEIRVSTSFKSSVKISLHRLHLNELYIFNNKHASWWTLARILVFFLFHIKILTFNELVQIVFVNWLKKHQRSIPMLVTGKGLSDQVYNCPWVWVTNHSQGSKTSSYDWCQDTHPHILVLISHPYKCNNSGL